MTPYASETNDVKDDGETDNFERDENGDMGEDDTNNLEDMRESDTNNLEDMREADTNILIPDTEYEEEVTVVKKGKKGVLMMAIGGVIFFISVLIQFTTYIGRRERAATIYAIITGLHLIFLGVFDHLDPKESASCEVTINGRQVANSIPLRAIILGTINLIFSVAGIICVSLMNPYYDWPAWNIIGLIISLLIAVVTLIHLSAGLLPNKYQLPIREAFNKQSSETPFLVKAALDATIQVTQDLVTNMAATTLALFPEFSSTSLGEILRSPKSLRQKALHHTMIALSMLIGVAMFAVQLLDIINSPKNTYNQPMSDPEDTYARTWIWSLRPAGSPSCTKLIVLISTPVTILLCLPLFFLTHRSSTLHLTLAFILAGAMAGFHCFLSVASMSWMILLGTSVSPLSYTFRFVITLCSPIMTSLLLSLAFSYLNTLIQTKEKADESSSCCLKTSSVLMTLVALLTISLTLASLMWTTGGITVTLQRHWNSTESGQHKDGCRDDQKFHPRRYYDDYGWNRQTTTPTPSTRPVSDYCYGVSLDYRVEDNFQFFSQSQLSLSKALLTLSLVLLLTGNKISGPILLFIGVITFVAANSTVISYFTGVYNYMEYAKGTPNLFDFHIINGCQVALGLVLGFGYSCVGCGFFVSLLSLLLRTILSILALSILLLLSLVASIINLARLSIQIAPIKKEEQIKEVNVLKEDKIKIDT